MTRTESMRSQKPVRVSGSRSLANPGSMPDVKQDAFPLRHASSSRWTDLASGVGTGLQPAILVDVDDLSHTEPVRSDGVGEDVEAGVAEGVVDVVLEPGLPDK